MRTAITISLVPEARGGPFVLWDDLRAACATAAALGFDAVELFAPGPEAVDPHELAALLRGHGLSLAAVGTGAGWLRHKLALTDADPAKRAQALAFVRSMIDLASRFHAPAIIGSMQGRSAAPGFESERTAAIDHLRRALDELGRYAQQRGCALIYEPLNRYETNLCNTLAAGSALLDSLDHGHVKLLGDLFHMNIEETDIAAAILAADARLAHVHFVDSNRRAPGMGHLDFAPIVAAMRSIAYAGYISAEALPLPDPHTAAAAAIAQYHALFP